MEALNKTIDEQGILIEALQSQLAGGSYGSINLNTQEINELNKKIDSLEYYIEQFRKASYDWKQKAQARDVKLDKMSSHLKSAKKELKRIKKSRFNDKLMAGFFVSTSIASASIAAYLYFF